MVYPSLSVEVDVYLQPGILASFQQSQAGKICSKLYSHDIYLLQFVPFYFTVVLVCETTYTVQQIMLQTQTLQMSTNEWVFLQFSDVPWYNMERPFLNPTEKNESETEIQQRKEAYYLLKMVWKYL